MADNVLGSVKIEISGDYSRLEADFVAASSMAQKAGQKVASNLSNGMESGLKSGAGLVDQFGRSISSVSDIASAAAPKLAKIVQPAVPQFFRNTGAAAQEAGEKVQSFVGLIPGLGRAAEMFVNMVPGLGQTIMSMLPLLGGFALAEGVFRIASGLSDSIDKAIGFKQAMEAAAEATKKTDGEVANLVKTMDRLAIKRMTETFGAASGLKLKANLGAIDTSADYSAAKTKDEAIKRLQAQFASDATLNAVISIFVPTYATKNYEKQVAQIKKLKEESIGLDVSGDAKAAEVAQDRFDAERAAKAEIAGIRLANIQKELAGNLQLMESNRAKAETEIRLARLVSEETVAAMEEPHFRAVSEAELEVKAAQDRLAKLKPIYEAEAAAKVSALGGEAAANKTNKTPNERAAIDIQLTREVATARADASDKITALYSAEAEAEEKYQVVRRTQMRMTTQFWDDEVTKGFSKADEEWRKALARGEQYQTEQAHIQTRIFEIQDAAQGTSKQEAIIGRKLQLERAYGLQVLQTVAQQVTHLRQVAALEQEARDAAIQGLRAKAETAQAAGKAGDSRELVRAAELTAEANKLDAESTNRRYENETKIAELKMRESLAGKLAANISGIPGQLGGALAGGLTSGSPGKAIGQEIRGALQGIGHQILGTVFTQLISTILVQTGVQSALAAMLGVNATATGINAAATTGNTAATVLNTFWLAIKSFLGFADGGRPPTGVPSIVGERGPEMFIPDQAGRIIPNHQLAGGAGLMLPMMAALNGNSIGSMNFHAHGMTNPREFVRMVAKELPAYLKSTGPNYGPASR